jgi:hypothetical protein
VGARLGVESKIFIKGGEVSHPGKNYNPGSIDQSNECAGIRELMAHGIADAGARQSTLNHITTHARACISSGRIARAAARTRLWWQKYRVI